MNVRWVRIGDVLELQRRAVVPEAGALYTEIGVRSFGKGLFIKEPVTGADIGNKRVFEIAPGDLVVSNIFGWEGAIAVAGEEHAGKIGSHRFMTWTAVEPIDVTYVCNYLLSEPGRASVREASPGSAGRNRTLSIKNFKAIQIPLPELPEQRRIAAHLDRMAQAARRPVSAAHDARSLVTNLVYASTTSCALGTMLTEDSEEIRVEPGRTYRQIGVFSHGRGVIDRGALAGADTKYKSMYRVRAGQVVMSRLKAFEGAAAVVPDEFDGAVVSKEFPAFTMNADVDPRFLRNVLRTPQVTAQLQAASTGVGARRERVSAARFLDVRVPALDPVEQRRIGDLSDIVDRLDRAAQRATTLRAALLPAARNEIFSSLR